MAQPVGASDAAGDGLVPPRDDVGQARHDQAPQHRIQQHGSGRGTRLQVTDNGSCFLARYFQKAIKDRFRHVRTRYRTPQQLGLLERFHQTLKREEVYWQLYEHPQDAREKLVTFRDRYNSIRPHWALAPAEGGDVLTPEDVYVKGRAITLPRWQGWAKAAKEKLDESMHQDAQLRQAA